MFPRMILRDCILYLLQVASIRINEVYDFSVSILEDPNGIFEISFYG